MRMIFVFSNMKLDQLGWTSRVPTSYCGFLILYYFPLWHSDHMALSLLYPFWIFFNGCLICHIYGDLGGSGSSSLFLRIPHMRKASASGKEQIWGQRNLSPSSSHSSPILLFSSSSSIVDDTSSTSCISLPPQKTNNHCWANLQWANWSGCRKNIARGTTDPGYWVHNSNNPNSGMNATFR